VRCHCFAGRPEQHEAADAAAREVQDALDLGGGVEGWGYSVVVGRRPGGEEGGYLVVIFVRCHFFSMGKRRGRAVVTGT
jgi:hypothetical protein